MQITQALKVEKNGDVKATFRIPEEVMKALKYRAIDENTPVNALVVKALKGMLRK